MKTPIQDLVKFANEIYEEDQDRMNKEIAFNEHMKLVFRKKFDTEYRPELISTYRNSKDLNKLIEQQRKLFNKSYQIY